jgi:hypothetical protein
MVLALVSCGGGEGGGDGTRPTISPTRTATATASGTELPSPTSTSEPTETPELPSPTSTSEPTETPELPSPTRSPTRTQTPDESSTLPTSDPPTTQEEPPSETPSATEQQTQEPSDTADEEPVEEEGVPTWVWWLLAALVVAAIAVPLVMRTQRRKTWRQAVAEQEGEIVWLARELLPGLRQAGSRELVAGGWAVGQTRVAAAEDRLTALESSAPDEADRRRALALRDAARQARGRMDQLTGPDPSEPMATGLDAIIADLEAILRPTPVP